MSVASTTNRVSYTGNGSVSAYSYTFRIFDDDDLLVTVKNTSDVETTLTKTTDYTVSGVGLGAGGTVTLVSSGQAWLTGGNLTTGYKLVIRRVIPITQNTDIRNQGDFYPEAHEDQFDRAVMIAQQQQDELDRTIKLSETTNAADFDTSFPADIVGADNKVPTVNSTGDGWAPADDWPTSTQITSAEGYAIAADASADLAQEWATNTASIVAATDYSSKEYAVGVQRRGIASGGSAKDWAVYTGGTVDNAEYSAKYHAQQAALSAAAAQWDDVSFKVFGDSPVSVVDGDAGVLFNVDCTGGNIVFNLAQISALTLTNPWSVGFKKTDSSANTITINRGGTDTFDDGTTSKTISYVNQGIILIPDTDSAPDEWTVVNFGDLSTLYSPTINTPTIDVITFDDQASTPSTPAAGLYKVYVKTDGRAYILNPSGVESGLGGGGGITVAWNQQANAPLDNLLGLIPVYEFEAGLAQELYAIINVPESYAPGSQIRLRIKGISNDTSGNVLFRAQSTLIRSEVDEYDSTTNQRTTTNSAITMSAANDKEPQKIILDITSTTGQVNAVSVAASDILIVRLYRDTDTATGSLYLVKGSEEVTIS